MLMVRCLINSLRFAPISSNEETKQSVSVRSSPAVHKVCMGENGTLNFGLCHSYWYPFLSALCGIFHIFVWNREMSPYYFIIIIITKKKTWMSGIYKIYHRPPQKTASWNLRRKYFPYFRLSLHNHAVITLPSLHPPTPQLPETHCGLQCSGPSLTILCW